VDPTLHTILRRSNSASHPITLSEWREAASGIPTFHITDKLKQQNPFTNEFTFFDLPGSGFWECGTLTNPVWSADDKVWFRFVGGTITFIQFSDVQHPELQSLATSLHAHVEAHRVGEG
jgi:hypothetical protein